MRRFGVFGGSFDPVHRGHVALARAAVKELKLDKLFVVPAFLSPLKNNRPFFSDRRRLALLRRAFPAGGRFRISRSEIRRGGVSYTVDTLRRLRRENPSAEWFLVMGEDSLAGFLRWKNSRGILKMARLAVGRRRGAGKIPSTLRKSALFLKTRLPTISSTEIRKKSNA